MSAQLTEAIQKSIAKRLTNKLESLDKDFRKKQSNASSTEELDELASDFAAKQLQLKNDFDPPTWLDNAARRAGQIRMATHAIKFTHSSAKGSSFLLQNNKSNPSYLDSLSLTDAAIDTVCNAAALDVAGLLLLKDEHQKSLIQYLQQEDLSPLAPLARSTLQLDAWHQGFKRVFDDSAPSSHNFAKQVYFPVNKDQSQYHLLAPLYSSSLSQAIYDAVHFSRYSQEMKAIRTAKKNNQPCEQKLLAYPNLACTISGGSRPRNVSQLNSGRGGRTYLLDARPPIWKNQSQRIKDIETFFNQPSLLFETQRTIKAIVNYLRAKLQRKSNLEIRENIEAKVDRIAEETINQAGVWQQQAPGWSDPYQRMPIHFAQWLDPGNPRWQEENLDWREAVSQAFGLWVKDRVQETAGSGENFSLGKGETDEWRQVFKRLLREMQ